VTLVLSLFINENRRNRAENILQPSAREIKKKKIREWRAAVLVVIF